MQKPSQLKAHGKVPGGYIFEPVLRSFIDSSLRSLKEKNHLYSEMDLNNTTDT